MLDSATSLQDLVLQEILDLSAVPTQLNWGMVSGDQYRERSEKVKEVLRSFTDLERNVVFVAKEKDHNPPKIERVSKSGKVQPDMRPKFLRGIGDESFIATDLGGATAGWLQDACDCVCRLFMEEEVVEQTITVNGKPIKQHSPTGKYVRYLRLQYHPNFAAGVRSCTPENVPEVMVKPSWKSLMQVLKS